MNEQLKSQLKGLQHPSPLLRRQATLGVFALLLNNKGPHQQQQADGVLQDVVLTCLTNPHPVCAVVAAERVACSAAAGNAVQQAASVCTTYATPTKPSLAGLLRIHHNGRCCPVDDMYSAPAAYLLWCLLFLHIAVIRMWWKRPCISCSRPQQQQAAAAAALVHQVNLNSSIYNNSNNHAYGCCFLFRMYRPE